MNTKIISFAIEAHQSTNHLYDQNPYSVHLAIVVSYAQKYIYLLPENLQDDVISACWLHDTIEDCRLTYNDLAQETNTNVAEIVFAVTNEKGKNRKERANAKYYEGIRNTAGAIFVKLCDRLANVKYSKDTSSRMLEVYKNEYPEFIKALFPDNLNGENEKMLYYPILKDLEEIINA